MHQVLSVDMEKDLLEANRKLAKENHDLLKNNRIRSIDIMGSIGSGKTLLIEKLSMLLKEKGIRAGVITGDVVGDDDYKRISSLRIPTVNVNTGNECHIDAHLAEHAIGELNLQGIDVLFVENVGNLVCPADFPLGTDIRIVVISVTEGDDMVRKHPVIFKEADVIVINKSDLAGVMEVSIDDLMKDASTVKPNSKVVVTDAKHSTGIMDLAIALGIVKGD
jgi:hydrogenase nickel incorporation protein HypB